MTATADAFFGIFGMTRVEQPVKLDVVVPICVTRGLNNREHFRVAAKRVRAEREAVQAALVSATARERRGHWAGILSDEDTLGARVTLLRPYSRIPLDSDNLSGAFKGVRDEVAAFLGVDDKSERIFWRYCQTKAKRRSAFYEGRPKDPLDTHIRLRIEILPASDVDPLLTAVRVLREAVHGLLVHDLAGGPCDGASTGCRCYGEASAALAAADALATFEPQDMYNV